MRGTALAPVLMWCLRVRDHFSMLCGPLGQESLTGSASGRYVHMKGAGNLDGASVHSLSLVTQSFVYRGDSGCDRRVCRGATGVSIEVVGILSVCDTR